jgi:ATP-dependent Clp protease ATP-binding subunit ClpC
MFENYTERAFMVINYAEMESEHWGATLVGTEHLFLGLLHETMGYAFIALSSEGVELEQARLILIENPIKCSDIEQKDLKNSRFTPTVTRILDSAKDIARQLERESTDTEHILLALIAETNQVVPNLFDDLLGIDSNNLLSTLFRLMSPGYKKDKLSPDIIKYAIIAYVILVFYFISTLKFTDIFSDRKINSDDE